MRRRSEPHLCVECGGILPERYKGRQRKYCNNNCRNLYTLKHPKVVVK